MTTTMLMEEVVFTSVNPTIRALAETILWSSFDENSAPLDENFSATDINQGCLDRLYLEYGQFLASVEKRITAIFGDNWDSIDEFYDVIQPVENQTEHDFILTRNGHGCGFWDGDWMPCVSEILTEAAKNFPEICAVVGDDGKVYLY
jgi:hypothetical protein